MDIQASGQALLIATIGALLLLGLAAESLGDKTRLPRVTLLIILGVVIGPEQLNLIPHMRESTFEVVTRLALMMVGFLLGGRLSRSNLLRYGKEVLSYSISISFITMVVVTLGVWLVSRDMVISLMLGAAAVATDPAATSDIVNQVRASGRYTTTLLGIVALDDAWGLIGFSLALAMIGLMQDTGVPTEVLAHGFYDLFGAVFLGLVIGAPAAYLSGRIRPGEPTLLEALGLVMLCGGLALWLGVSYILASIVLGVVIVNLARHHKYPFHEIRRIEQPFLVLFFILGGASLDLHHLWMSGLVGLAYLVLRVLGRVLGALAVGRSMHTPVANNIWLGLALMPQAGIALGMALLATERHPQFRETLLPIVIGSTILFELTGPVVTYIALRRFGEMPEQRKD